MIQNLTERFLYSRLPGAVITGDERGLLEAVCCGFNDRIDDFRSYARKLGAFYAPGGLPDGPNNAILVDVSGGQGQVFTKSLDPQTDTPATSGPALTLWAAQQLNLPVTSIANVRYGRDLLRLVDASVLSYLATTLGATLYQSIVLSDASQTAANTALVQTWFPRLKIKGTARSFEVLGRLLGFEDVRFTPLWTRLSPRKPDDVGDPANDADFSAASEYFPKQTIDAFYDPFAFRDGPFFSWSTVVSNGTADDNFYTQAVNGFNPWVTAVVSSIAHGTVAHPATGAYVLAGGQPNFKASVAPPGSGVLFTAVTEGEDFNGLVLDVVTNGSLCSLTISDRLSGIKYRSSYFDIGLASSMDTLEEVFGSRAATTNRDLQAGTLTPDGPVSAPYRPWVGGSIAVAGTAGDWLTVSGGLGATETARQQADPVVSRQLNVDAALAAGVQVTQAFEEVRPATRQARRSQLGFVWDDAVPYAAYPASALPLLTTEASVSVYSGSYAGTPLLSYPASVRVVIGSGTLNGYPEQDQFDNTLVHYHLADAGQTNLAVDGTFTIEDGSYWFNLTGMTVPAGAEINVVRWQPVTTEVVRAEPTWSAKASGTSADPLQYPGYSGLTNIQARPEDLEDDVLALESADDVGWRRDLVAGGELVELDTYQSGTELAVDPVVAATAFTDQTGVPLDVLGVTSRYSPMRIVVARPAGSVPIAGGLAIGYQGEFRDLAAFTADDTALPKPVTGAEVGDTATDYDTLFAPGYRLFHVGVAQGVLVADLPAFFGAHHRDRLVGWFDLSAHPDDDLSPPDRSVYAADLAASGVVYTDRVWDAERGWSLRLRSGGTLASSAWRAVTDEVTASFWVKAAPQAIREEVIVRAGPLQFTTDGTNYRGYVVDAAGTSHYTGSYAVNDEWQFVYQRVAADNAWISFGTLAYAGTEDGYSGQPLPPLPAQSVVVTAAAANFQLQDLRLWNVQKSVADMSRVRYHNPTPTICPYPLGIVPTLDRQDRYGLQIRPSGWAFPGQLPAWYRRPAQGLVRRYDAMGAYHGEERFRETGLGGGAAPPDNYALGQQFVAVAGDGTIIFCTTSGYLPGYSDYWGSQSHDTGMVEAGTYVRLAYDAVAVSLGTGFPVEYVYSGTSAGSEWPNWMAQTNPFRESIWARDATGGQVYSVRLAGDATSVTLEAAPVVRGRSASELALDPALGPLLAAGTVSVVMAGMLVNGTLTGGNGTLWYPSGSKVFTEADLYVSEQPTGPFTVDLRSVTSVAAYDGSAPLTSYYLYLTNRVNVAVPEANTTWTDAGAATAQTNGVDYSAAPQIVTLTGSGAYLALPVLGQDGILEFQNNSHLVAGDYWLTVVSGQVGQPDADFRGFKVRLTVNNDIFDVTLLAGQTGYNFSGTDVLPLTLTGEVNGNWLLSFDWTNALQDRSRGTQRQLAIYGYELHQRVTEPYQVQLAPPTAACAPIITGPLALTSPATAPGGWLAALNSYGNVAWYQHEATVHTVSDTVTNPLPLASVLTPTTSDRREDEVYAGDGVVLADPADYVFPTFYGGSVAVTPGGLMQVGDTGTFSVSGYGSVSAIYSYVWGFWDDTGTATPGPSVMKVINVGSNPGAGPDGLQVSCQPVAFDGQSVVLLGTLAANNAPQLLPGAYLTANDGYFPYATEAGLTAFDFNNDQLFFAWYQNGVFVSHGTTVVIGAQAGTWSGNGVTVVGNYSGTSNYIDVLVAVAGSLTCVVSDARAGAATLDFNLRGQPLPSLHATVGAGAAGLLADASAVPTQRIGLGQTVDFTIYAQDPAGGTLSFNWAFYGSNGWTNTGYDAGTTALQPDGSYQNSVARDLATEVIATGQQKVVEAVCLVMSSNGQTTTAAVDVLLLADSPPDELSLVITANGSPVTGAVTAGQMLEYDATGTDTDADWLSYEWVLSQPVMPYSNRRWGPKVRLDTTGYASGQTVGGVVTATDRLGGSYTVALPAVVVD